MIALAWIALGLLVLGLYTYFSPRFWAARDAKDFGKDPANDTFHNKFHRQRLTWRVVITGVVALITSLPWGIFLGWGCYPLAFLSYGVSSGGYFAYAFNHLLSVARKLSYVAENYVSPDPRAANPDRWIWNFITNLLGTVLRDTTPPLYVEAGKVSTIGQIVAGGVLELLTKGVLLYSQTVAFFLLVLALVVGLG